MLVLQANRGCSGSRWSLFWFFWDFPTVVSDGFWWFLMVSDGFLMVSDGFCWFLLVSDDCLGGWFLRLFWGSWCFTLRDAQTAAHLRFFWPYTITTCWLRRLAPWLRGNHLGCSMEVSGSPKTTKNNLHDCYIMLHLLHDCSMVVPWFLCFASPQRGLGTVGSGNTQVFVCDEHFILRVTWRCEMMWMDLTPSNTQLDPMGPSEWGHFYQQSSCDQHAGWFIAIWALIAMGTFFSLQNRCSIGESLQKPVLTHHVWRLVISWN